MKLISKKVKIESQYKIIESEEDFSDLFNDWNVRDGVLYLTHLNFINGIKIFRLQRRTY